MGQVVSLISQVFMVLGGVIPYIPQYLEIKKSRNAEGFSLYVCLTLLIAYTLRILFWFGRPFELPLLLQSVIMIVAMFAMIHLCMVVRSSSEIIATKAHTFTGEAETSENDQTNDVGSTSASATNTDHRSLRKTFFDFDMAYFWRWTDFLSYVEFISVFSLVSSVVTYLLLDVPTYIEALGFLALLTEAMLAMPQAYRNLKNQSTKGMSLKMVVFWLLGDIYKTAYYVLRATPLQFRMCGALQVLIDCLILAQVQYYRPDKRFS